MATIMLIEFSVANFRSFKEQQRISLVAGSGAEHRSQNVSRSGIKAIDLVRSAAVYGANASGKSNFFRALQTLQVLVQYSALLPRGQSLPGVVPFRLSTDNIDQPSDFEITFVADRVRYQYGCSVLPNRIVREWLIAYPRGRPQRWFERDQQAIDGKKWRFGPNFQGDRGQRKVWKESTPAPAPRHYWVQLNNSQLRTAFTWLTQQLIVLVPGVEMNPFLSFELLREPKGHERIMEFIHAADIDIERLELQEEDVPASSQIPAGGVFRVQLLQLGGVPPGQSPGKQYRVLTWHRRRDDGREVQFDLTEESDGTRKLFEFVGGLLRAIDNGSTVCIDELDRSLHPRITRFLVRLFQQRAGNKKNAQLIFSTHDVTLMDSELLRRDQIWFVEKDKVCGSRVYPLLDYSPRKDEALERGYLKGRYGAVPNTGTTGR